MLSVLVLAYPEHLKQTQGRKFHKHFRKVLIPVNIFVQLFNGAATTGAAIFGPVAIIMPVTVSAQLLFNILIFGYLQMEEFGKDVQVGTFIVVLGSVMLPVVGPTVQQNQDITELLMHPQSLVWTSFLFSGVLISGIACFGCVHTKRWEAESRLVYVCLAVARVFSSVLSASLSKALALVTGLQLAVVICGFLICGFVLGTSVVLQATKTEQRLFVPLISCLTQLVNAVTGLILWEDWRVVQSWAGYSAVTIQIIVGVYLISSLDFFQNTADPHYGFNQSFRITNESMRNFNIQLLKDDANENTNTKTKTNTNADTKHEESSSGGDSPNNETFEEDALEHGFNLQSSKSSSLQQLGGLASTSSVRSIRGLIGGIKQEPSYRQTDACDVRIDISNNEGRFDERHATKVLVRSMLLAEKASKRGERRFVTPPQICEVDSVNFDPPSILSQEEHEAGKCHCYK